MIEKEQTSFGRRLVVSLPAGLSVSRVAARAAGLACGFSAAVVEVSGVRGRAYRVIVDIAERDAQSPRSPVDALPAKLPFARRIERLLDSGRRAVTAETVGPDLPVLLLVIDEVARFTASLQPKASAELCRRLASVLRMGRTVAVVVVACCHRPSSDVLPTAVRDLLRTRWAA